MHSKMEHGRGTVEGCLQGMMAMVVVAMVAGHSERGSKVQDLPCAGGQMCRAWLPPPSASNSSRQNTCPGSTGQPRSKKRAHGPRGWTSSPVSWTVWWKVQPSTGRGFYPSCPCSHDCCGEATAAVAPSTAVAVARGATALGVFPSFPPHLLLTCSRAPGVCPCRWRCCVVCPLQGRIWGWRKLGRLWWLWERL